ncbi:hypothetical protein PAECIP111802_07037 [Paenibacillus allorhizosphaerae]|uniref:DNA (cytosine-5-)-methyltransferase n=1 Tax=Paenibacillus allorhizosphaerae TaxID=2849866 RepID=A0ABM8VU67_9BACL|nr:hypothetical protein PAECIP111802_07037 [Paenibacillus allorhizosphaerae]
MQKSGVVDSPAKTSLLRTKVKEKDLKVIEVDSSTSMPSLLTNEDLSGYLLKMYQDSSIATTEMISEWSSKPWMNSGMVWRGEYWMQNTLEHPNDAEESTLSQVIEADAPLKYFLNKVQLQSLLDRASARGKSLAPDLERALSLQISTLSSMPELDERLQPDPKQKGTEMMEKPIHLTPEAAQTLFVRRMLPSEYEKLQGFPVGWTEVDTEL